MLHRVGDAPAVRRNVGIRRPRAAGQAPRPRAADIDGVEIRLQRHLRVHLGLIEDERVSGDRDARAEKSVRDFPGNAARGRPRTQGRKAMRIGDRVEERPDRGRSWARARRNRGSSRAGRTARTTRDRAAQPASKSRHRSPSERPNTFVNAGAPRKGIRPAVASVSRASGRFAVAVGEVLVKEARRTRTASGRRASRPGRRRRDRAARTATRAAATSTIARKSAVANAPAAPVSALSSNVASALDLPDRQEQVGKQHRQPAEHAAQPADPAAAAAEVHDVRVLVREHQAQPVVGVADDCSRRGGAAAVISIVL